MGADRDERVARGCMQRISSTPSPVGRHKRKKQKYGIKMDLRQAGVVHRPIVSLASVANRCNND